MQQQGLATLWACTLLLLLTGLWGWLGLQAVNAESTRGSQQMHAAQALANAEANLETAVVHLAQVLWTSGHRCRFANLVVCICRHLPGGQIPTAMAMRAVGPRSLTTA